MRMPLTELSTGSAFSSPGFRTSSRILHELGFVQVRPDGQKRLYSLRPEPFRELDAWVASYRSFWEARLDKFAEALNQKAKAHSTKRNETSK